jgi:hypothetical protein
MRKAVTVDEPRGDLVTGQHREEVEVLPSGKATDDAHIRKVASSRQRIVTQVGLPAWLSFEREAALKCCFGDLELLRGGFTGAKVLLELVTRPG